MDIPFDSSSDRPINMERSTSVFIDDSIRISAPLSAKAFPAWFKLQMLGVSASDCIRFPEQDLPVRRSLPPIDTGRYLKVTLPGLNGLSSVLYLDVGALWE